MITKSLKCFSILVLFLFFVPGPFQAQDWEMDLNWIKGEGLSQRISYEIPDFQITFLVYCKESAFTDMADLKEVPIKDLWNSFSLRTPYLSIGPSKALGLILFLIFCFLLLH